MSSIQFGLPLDEPSKQTLLPYITDSGRVYGFFPITETTFEGTETTFTVSEGYTVSLKTVTLPPTVSTNLREQYRVEQYMAAYFPSSIEGQKPWVGYPTLMRSDEPNPLGYYSWWSMPVRTVLHHFSYGTYITALINNLAPNIGTGSTSEPPVTTPQTLEWACSVDLQAFQPDCAFFDFSWTALFQTAPLFNPDQAGNTVIPASITVVSNPGGGVFKAVQVQSGGQSIYPGGGVTFDTIRILKLKDAEAGTYTFTFAIQYAYAGSTANPSTVTATLNLTVV